MVRPCASEQAWSGLGLLWPAGGGTAGQTPRASSRELEDLLASMKRDAEVSPARLRRRKYINVALVIIDAVLATAILDRLLHKSHVLNIKGRSYRLR